MSIRPHSTVRRQIDRHQIDAPDAILVFVVRFNVATPSPQQRRELACINRAFRRAILTCPDPHLDEHQFVAIQAQ